MEKRLGIMKLLFGVVCTVAGAAAAQPDAASASAQMDLESARYLFEIEGDTVAAQRILNRLEASNDTGIRTQAEFLQGRFRESEGQSESAIRAYTQALGGQGLSAAEKRALYHRLLALHPGAIQPLRPAGRVTGSTRVFADASSGTPRYVLVEDPKSPETESEQVQYQDEDGLLHSVPASLLPGEDVLDATPDLLLTVLRDKQQVYLRKAPNFAPNPAPEKFAADQGMLLPARGEPDEFLLIGSQSLKLMQRDRTVFSSPLPGPGCTYLPARPRSREGVLFCPSEGVYRADFTRHSLSPLALSGELPSEALLSGDYLALRYLDHIEIRRGPAFDAFLWGFPSEMQDQLVLGHEHAFLVQNQGALKAFELRTGQMDWQHDDGIAEILPAADGLFALTHAGTCLSLGEDGRTLFRYEVGWGHDPLLLPTRDWLVVQRADGQRVRLNRELLQMTGDDRSYLFRGVQDCLKRHDEEGALRALDTLLELEPGNGEAWRQKAQLLRSTGAAHKEVIEAWLQLARSPVVAPWSADPALRSLARAFAAGWVWKQHSGPRFFPTLVAGPGVSFYVENDNQTLALLDNTTGALKNSFHFSEALDLKAACWVGDTAVVSSPTRLYLLTPFSPADLPPPVPLPQPICQAVPVAGGLVYSDWGGNVQFLALPQRHIRWQRHLSRNGLLLAKSRLPDQIDAFEIEGGYYGLQISTGRILGRVRMPPGTVTELHAGHEYAYAGYNEGLLVAVDRQRDSIAWQKDIGEQIFSLDGWGDQILLGTASKRILTVQGSTGAIVAQTQLSTYLFNRPLVVEDGYWVGTTEPALEKRSWTHALLEHLPLTSMPGTPALLGDGIAISTLDHFIMFFPAQ